MKKVFLFVSEAAKSCLNAVMGALYFIKLDHDVAHFPDAEGGIAQRDYYYSIYDKLFSESLQVLVYLSLVVMAVSVVLSVVACIAKDNRKIRIASHIVFAVSALFFLALLFYAMQIHYGY